ncbi:MAG TPA: prephenate dehydratase [Desulfatiglandales bacterium]|nr:prephenate dehydratase [Desulfatiglandales bacterium]
MKQESKKESDWQALDELREEIDRIDEQIVSLLSRRQQSGIEIGKLKKELGINIIDLARERQILRRVVSFGRENLSAQSLRAIFSEIISAGRSVQETPSVAYLGPEDSFTQRAAIAFFGHSTSFHAAGTIEDVFGLVEKGVCKQGVVPIENSYEGSVNRTLDLFYKYNLKIGAEIFLRIRQHFLSKAGSIKEIKLVHAHPMSIAQCKGWLRDHIPEVSFKEANSTSLAAKLAAQEPGTAALGSRLAAHTYGLNILEENIEDHPDNITRFLIIGKTDAEPTGRDKTSILFSLRHQPGALYKALEPISRKNINMARIESRPLKIKNWEYLFFVDLEGHESNGNVSDAIKEMEAHCSFIKRLGSYPAGGEPWD